MQKYKNLLKGISRNILLLGLVSFLNDMSSEIVMPILPLFIVYLGGSEVVIGLISGTMESISSLLKVICGHLSDRIGKRKIFVGFGYSISAVFKFLLSFSMVGKSVRLRWSGVMEMYPSSIAEKSVPSSGIHDGGSPPRI